MTYYEDDQKILQIQDQLDIVELISETVQLSRRGNNYWGLCPFHGEKTPSFSVSRDKQMFYCFGCHTGGNIFTYVMKKNGLEFREALELLAAKAGVELTRPQDRSRADLNKAIAGINNVAAQFYHQNLLGASGKTARSYLERRGVNEQTIKTYILGYAGEDWQGLTDFLLGKGYHAEILKASGLIKRSDGQDRFYDLFRNRIIFPIMLYNRDVIGFGGRNLGDALPKYLNTPETELFSKRKNLYGLAQARENIREKNNAIIVEGYMDCIKLHQTGIMNVVATLGTALTGEQAQLLRRYTEKVTVIYDGDEAGQNATMRAAGILRQAGVKVEIISLPAGKDPDDLIEYLGKEGFLNYIENNVCSCIEFNLKRHIQATPLLDLDAKIRIINTLKEDIDNLDSWVEKDSYIKLLARKLKVEENIIYQEFRQSNNHRQYRNNNVRIRDNIKYGKYGLQEKILAAILKDPLLYEKIKSSIGIKFFANPEYQAFIYEYDRLQGEPNDRIKKIAAGVNSEAAAATNAMIAMLIDDEKESDNADREVEEFIMRVEQKKAEQELEKTIGQVASLGDQGDFSSFLKFIAKVNNIENLTREGGSL